MSQVFPFEEGFGRNN